MTCPICNHQILKNKCEMCGYKIYKAKSAIFKNIFAKKKRPQENELVINIINFLKSFWR